MQQFTSDLGWDQCRADVRFTIATLRASGAHGRLISALAGLMGQWGELEGERQSTQDAIDDANAEVTWVDELLDAAVKRFSTRLLAEADAHGRDVYDAYFPEAPNLVTVMALERECDRVAEWQNTRKVVAVPPAAEASLDEVFELEARGREVIQKRKDAVAAQARVSLKIGAWKGAANSVRRDTETSLDAYANAHKLPRTYAARFFPKPARVKAKKEAAPQPAPQPARPSQLPPH